jgi:hypothetical protein
VIRELPDAGVDFDDVTHTLETEGVASFAKSFDDAVREMEQRIAEVAA